MINSFFSEDYNNIIIMMMMIMQSVSELSLVSRRPLSADFTLFASSSVGDSVRSSSTSASELEPCTPAALLGSSPTSPSSVRPYDALQVYIYLIIKDPDYSLKDLLFLNRESTGAASTLHGLLARPPVSRAQHTAQRFDRNNGAILNGTHPVKAESVTTEPALLTMTAASNSVGGTGASPALTGFGVSAAGVNLSVNIGVNITGVTPEAAAAAAAAAPWATAAAYTSRYRIS